MITLVQNNPKIQQQLNEFGACQVVLEGVKRHLEDDDTARVGIGALMCISNKNPKSRQQLNELGAYKVVLEVAKRNLEDDDTQQVKEWFKRNVDIL